MHLLGVLNLQVRSVPCLGHSRTIVFTFNLNNHKMSYMAKPICEIQIRKTIKPTRIWNKLPELRKNIPSLAKQKRKYKSRICLKNEYFVFVQKTENENRKILL